MIKYVLIIALLIFLPKHSPVDADSPVCAPPTFFPDTHYPVTSEFYMQFMNAQTEFSSIQLFYYLGLSSMCDDEQVLDLLLDSNYDFDEDDYWVDMTIEDLAFFIGYYSDLDICSPQCITGYSIDEYIMPLFEIIEDDLEYYCNAEEYGEEDSLEFISPRELGFDFGCYVMMVFYPPDIRMNDSPPLKAFIKGWHPCDDPPVELMPLIDYLEEVIIPIARQHPD